MNRLGVNIPAKKRGAFPCLLRWFSITGRLVVAILLMVGAISCGERKSGYTQTLTADEWARQGGEVYDDADILPSDSDESVESEEADMQQKDQDSASGLKDSPAEIASKSEKHEDEESAKVAEDTPRRRVAAGRLGNLAELFNDSNHYQLLHAERLGIDPITDLRSYYHTKRPLVKVTTNDDFRVDELTHSFPFLVPEAERLLHDIGRAFRDSVKARRGGDYRMVVTSLLRTPVTVKRLRRVNRNATEQSTHQYATTFDISYNKFDAVSGPDNADYGDLKIILAEVIRNLHKEGRCMVKYERKSPCFHITVVR